MSGQPIDVEKLHEARELRDRGVSIRTISAITGVPRSTLGDHLRGYGETVVEIRCEHCGGETVDFRGRKRFCSNGCRCACPYDRRAA